MPKQNVITNFDSTNVKFLAAELLLAAKAIAAKYNLSAKTNGGSFSSESFDPKISFFIPVKDKSGMDFSSEEKKAFLANAKFVGINPDSFGKTIVINKKSFTIAGWASSSRTTPIVIIDSTGKRFKTKTHVIAAMYPISKTVNTKESSENTQKVEVGKFWTRRKLLSKLEKLNNVNTVEILTEKVGKTIELKVKPKVASPHFAEDIKTSVSKIPNFIKVLEVGKGRLGITLKFKLV